MNKQLEITTELANKFKSNVYILSSNTFTDPYKITGLDMAGCSFKVEQSNSDEQSSTIFTINLMTPFIDDNLDKVSIHETISIILIDPQGTRSAVDYYQWIDGKIIEKRWQLLNGFTQDRTYVFKFNHINTGIYK